MEKIDLEPTWYELCMMVSSGHLNGRELIPACQIADVVRQAQKQGKSKVTFTFENGQVSFEAE